MNNSLSARKHALIPMILLITGIANAVIFPAAFSTFTPSAYAESLQKHPRVAELEDTMRESTSVYLKTRFPDRPFLVNVSIDPLRRTTAKGTEMGESLPYFDGGNFDEIQDEWDDPQVGLHTLLLRTTKITVQVTLNDTLSEADATEVKESLFQNLHLIPARDEIKIGFRAWVTKEQNLFYPSLAVALAVLFLLSFFLFSGRAYRNCHTL